MSIEEKTVLVEEFKRFIDSDSVGILTVCKKVSGDILVKQEVKVLLKKDTGNWWVIGQHDL